MNKFIDKVEAKKNKPEVVIKDLVSSFLIPDVQRKQVQKKVQFEEKKFLEAARNIIKNSTTDAGKKLDGDNFGGNL